MIRLFSRRTAAYSRQFVSRIGAAAPRLGLGLDLLGKRELAASMESPSAAISFTPLYRRFAKGNTPPRPTRGEVTSPAGTGSAGSRRRRPPWRAETDGREFLDPPQVTLPADLTHRRVPTGNPHQPFPPALHFRKLDLSGRWAGEQLAAPRDLETAGTLPRGHDGLVNIFKRKYRKRDNSQDESRPHP